MPSTLPVPSKGALRTLRNLALGTSFTVAFSTGLLTEDRRRRIHTAREIHDNGQKLKASRKYHSTGTGNIEVFEELATRYQDDAFWLPSNVAGSRGFTTTVPEELKQARKTTVPARSALPEPASRHRSMSRNPTISARLVAEGKTKSHPKTPLLAAQKQRQPAEPVKTNIHNRQHKLASDVRKLLGGREEESDIHAAASRFFEAFEEGLEVGEHGLLPVLVDAAIELSEAGFANSNFDITEQVLVIVSRHGPVDEEQFHKFNPELVIKQLMTGPAVLPAGGTYVDEEKLNAATSIYLTTFKAKPNTESSEQMQILGQKLCAATCQAGLYDLTLKLFARLERQRGQRPLRAVNHLIEAANAKGQHEKIFRYFKKFYTQTSPDQLQFFKVGNLVIDSVLKRNDIEKAEEVLADAKKMAESSGMLMSSTWLLKILGHDWRTHRDITRTRSLFDRMSQMLPLLAHPQAVYGAIIQFCSEADQEAAAYEYYNELSKTYKEISSDLRIRGHLVLAKGRRSDWNAALQDLHEISRSNPLRTGEYSAMFAHILKQFVQSHTVQQTEEFLHPFIEAHQIQITNSIFNIMVHAYCKSREIDSMARWIKYATSQGCRVDTATINTILTNCWRTWRYKYDDCFALYNAIQKLERGSASTVTNGSTVELLRQIAVSSGCHDTFRRNRALLRKLDQPQPEQDPWYIHDAMLEARSKECPADVLKIYKDALAEHIKLDCKHLMLAVNASIDIDAAGLDGPISLIQVAQENGQDVSAVAARLIVHQMELMDADDMGPGPFAAMVTKAISVLQKSGIKASSNVTTHALSILVRHGRTQSAVKLWESVSRNLNQLPSSVNLPTLTVLLKAYIILRDRTGVEWAMKMLSVNELTPDRAFYRLLKEERKEIRKMAKTQPSNFKVQEFLNTISAAFQQVVEMRESLEDEKKDVKSQTIEIIGKALEEQERRDIEVIPIKKAAPEARWEKEVYSGRMTPIYPESTMRGYTLSTSSGRDFGVSAA